MDSHTLNRVALRLFEMGDDDGSRSLALRDPTFNDFRSDVRRVIKRCLDVDAPPTVEELRELLADLRNDCIGPLELLRSNIDAAESYLDVG